MNPNTVYIDALNLAYWCGAPPSLRLPLCALAELLRAGIAATLVFDANARYRLQHEADVYAALAVDEQHVVVAPSGRPADRVMLRLATACGGRVLSRDKFADHRRRYRKLIDDPARLLPGWVHQDTLHLPALQIAASLPADAQAAWQSLLPLLPTVS